MWGVESIPYSFLLFPNELSPIVVEGSVFVVLVSGIDLVCYQGERDLMGGGDWSQGAAEEEEGRF